MFRGTTSYKERAKHILKDALIIFGILFIFHSPKQATRPLLDSEMANLRPSTLITSHDLIIA
jgi:hypothetical protein